MRKVCIALLACVSLTMLGLEALTPEDYIYQTTEQAAPPPSRQPKRQRLKNIVIVGPEAIEARRERGGKEAVEGQMVKPS